MIGTRLPLALAAGAALTGRVAVFNAAAAADLSALADPHVISPSAVVHGTHDIAGTPCAVAPEGPYDAAIVCVPRAKAEARHLIAQACAATSGIVIIDGQKTDGIDSIRRDIRSRVDASDAISKAHGKLFWFAASDAFADWHCPPALTSGGFWTAPGVFSADEVDPASAMLAAHLPDDLGGHVADLGAGWGFLSAHVCTRPKVKSVHLVEAHHMALECAKRNVTDPRAAFHWTDATTWQGPRMDAVVMNPPFHVGRAADAGLGQAFIASAARVLAPSGVLWMVSNRHLPYEQTLSAQFAHVEEVGGDGRFKITRAVRPRRGAGQAR